MSEWISRLSKYLWRPVYVKHLKRLQHLDLNPYIIVYDKIQLNIDYIMEKSDFDCLCGGVNQMIHHSYIWDNTPLNDATVELNCGSLCLEGDLQSAIRE